MTLSRKAAVVLILSLVLSGSMGTGVLRAQPEGVRGTSAGQQFGGLWSPVLEASLARPGAAPHDTGFNGLTLHSVLVNLKRKDFQSQLGAETLKRLDTYMAQEIGSPEKFEALSSDEKEAIYDLAASVIADFVRTETRAAVLSVEKGKVGDDEVYRVHGRLQDAVELGIVAPRDQKGVEKAIQALAPRVTDKTRGRVEDISRRLGGLKFTPSESLTREYLRILQAQSGKPAPTTAPKAEVPAEVSNLRYGARRSANAFLAFAGDIDSAAKNKIRFFPEGGLLDAVRPLEKDVPAPLLKLIGQTIMRLRLGALSPAVQKDRVEQIAGALVGISEMKEQNPEIFMAKARIALDRVDFKGSTSAANVAGLAGMLAISIGALVSLAHVTFAPLAQSFALLPLVFKGVGSAGTVMVHAVPWALISVGIAFITQLVNESYIKHYNPIGAMPRTRLYATLPLMAALEEVCFRLVLQGGTTYLLTLVSMPVLPAVLLGSLLSSTLFARAHSYGPMLPRFVGGVLFGYLFLTQGLLFASAVHFLSNLTLIGLSEFVGMVDRLARKDPGTKASLSRLAMLIPTALLLFYPAASAFAATAMPEKHQLVMAAEGLAAAFVALKALQWGMRAAFFPFKLVFNLALWAVLLGAVGAAAAAWWF